jgi:hypothetical protein
MPYLIFFRHGYVPLTLKNASREKFVALLGDPRSWSTRHLRVNLPFEFDADRVVQESFWNGLTIELEPFRGTPARWFDLLSHASHLIEFEDLRRVPRFVAAILAEEAYFRANPPDTAEVSTSRLTTFFRSLELAVR